MKPPVGSVVPVEPEPQPACEDEDPHPRRPQGAPIPRPQARIKQARNLERHIFFRKGHVIDIFFY